MMPIEAARARPTACARILGLTLQQAAALPASLSCTTRPTSIVNRQLTEQQSEAVRAGPGSAGAEPARPRAARRALLSERGRLAGNDARQPAAGLRHPGRAGPLRRRAGQPGRPRRCRQRHGRHRAQSAPLPSTGGSVQLTIDASLQLRLEKELYAAWVADRAPRVSGLVMDPYTGRDTGLWLRSRLRRQRLRRCRPELARSVCRPDPQPGLRARLGHEDVHRRGRARGGRGQPRYADRGPAARSSSAPTRSRTSTRRAWASSRSRTPSPTRATWPRARSRMMLAPTTDEAAAVLYDMWRRLGIGQPTGIELDNEVGRARDRSCRPALAADRPRQPRLRPGRRRDADPARRCLRGDGQRRHARPSAHLSPRTMPRPCRTPQQVISPELSAQLRQLMIHVVDEGPHYAAGDEDRRLCRGWQDGHRPDMGQREGRLVGHDLQPHLRRLRRRRAARGNHPRAYPRHRAARPEEVGHVARDDVERALPARRPGHHLGP